MKSKEDYVPKLLRINQEDDFNQFRSHQSNNEVRVYDQIDLQLVELVKNRNANQKFSKNELVELSYELVSKQDRLNYGVWVYYPWLNSLVHLLDEEEFVFLRTIRNKYKITEAEQNTLSKQTIGIIGLSVGQSSAITMVMERICGKIKLADFDELELTNMNRIRSRVHEIGVPKVLNTAREIAEIDPYIQVECFFDGINEENADDFLLNPRLDICVDECDDIHTKIFIREKAKAHGIPVVMETSDKGMIDIERFDKDSSKPIFHGLLDGMDLSKTKYLKTNEEKVGYVVPILGMENVSQRMKSSMLEIEESITSWPQLSSDVVLGGAISTNVCRRILLDKLTMSGRFYIDLDELISEGNEFEFIKRAKTKLVQRVKDRPLPWPEHIVEMVKAAVSAPSGGNSQPWLWDYDGKSLTLQLDKERSSSLLDYKHYGGFLALGAATENLILKASELGYRVIIDINDEKEFLVKYTIKKSSEGLPDHSLSKSIIYRCTNRHKPLNQPVKTEFLMEIKTTAEIIDNVNLEIVDSKDKIDFLTEYIAAVERLRLLDEKGHQDFYDELRWSEEENENTRDGIDIETIELSQSDLVGLKVASDWQVMKYLRDMGLGKAFKKLIKKNMNGTPAICILSTKGYSNLEYFNVGRALERAWLKATELGIAFQPVSPITFFFARLTESNGAGLDPWVKDEMAQLQKQYEAQFKKSSSNTKDLFIFRLFMTDKFPKKSIRRSLEDIVLDRNN